MGKNWLISAFVFLSFGSLIAQYDKAFFDEVGGIEVLLENDKDAFILIKNGVYPDHGARPDHPQFYIGYREYQILQKLNIPFIKLEKKKPVIKMMDYDGIKRWQQSKSADPMDFYPTYEAYEQMMYDFADNYPNLCRILNIGTLNSGRNLLVAHISSQHNQDTLAGKANFLYTSTMHGDELAGFPIMLNMIDTLLSSYGTSDELTTLVDDLNIYINPLANPDGAYRNSNATVANASRFNSQFVDLNRNYPDAEVGDNPDGRQYQDETLAFVKFAEDYRINLSCNIHGGIELVNYPWDTFQKLTADDRWWVHVCREYVDTVHVHSPQGYMSAFDNGVTNGWAWFEAKGSRQDHITFFEGGREFTLEISNQKSLDANLLPAYWNYNKASLINYMHQARYGIKGTVIDCKTGEPVEANIFIPNHDFDNSDVFSRPEDGAFFRYLEEGNYELSITAEGYIDETQLVQIVDKSTLGLTIELCPLETSVAEDNINPDLNIIINHNIIILDSEKQLNNFDYELLDNSGRLIQNGKLVDKSIELNSELISGIYILKLGNGDLEYNKSVFIGK